MDSLWATERSRVATFYNNVTISLSTLQPGHIYYTSDGTAPSPDSKEYDAPIRLSQSATVKAQLFSSEGIPQGQSWIQVFKKDEREP